MKEVAMKMVHELSVLTRSGKVEYQSDLNPAYSINNGALSVTTDHPTRHGKTITVVYPPGEWYEMDYVSPNDRNL